MDMSHLGDCWGQDALPVITRIISAGRGKSKLPLLLEQWGPAGTRCTPSCGGDTGHTEGGFHCSGVNEKTGCWCPSTWRKLQSKPAGWMH